MKLKSVKAEINYRGHTIAASREQSQAGYSLLYYTIVRNSDLFIVVDSFTEEDCSPAKYVNMLTDRVDAEIAETAEKCSKCNGRGFLLSSPEMPNCDRCRGEGELIPKEVTS